MPEAAPPDGIVVPACLEHLFRFSHRNIEAEEERLTVGLREFAEETEQTVEGCAPGATLIPQGTVRHRSTMVVAAWMREGD